MSKSTETSTTLIIAAIIVIALGLGYFFLTGQREAVAPAETAQTEMTSAPETPSVQETVPTPEVAMSNPIVKTKTLASPAAKINIPSAQASSNPAVEKMMEQRKIGSDNAPIKVVEYSSLTCGHCATFHKNDFVTIKAEYIDTGKVQFIFKEFPLNKPAMDASKLLRCLPVERFDSFMALLFSQQEKWAFVEDYLTPLKQDAKLAGLSEDQAVACLANKDLETRITGDMKAATDSYKIQATPSFVINDGVKIISGHQPIEFFRTTFDEILGTAAQATPPAKQ